MVGWMLQSGRWGKSLLCPSVLLCQFVLWLLINENCCYNFKLLQFLPVVRFFFLPPATGPSFCRGLSKRQEVYGKNICNFLQTPLCNTTRESHIQKKLWKVITGHLHAQTLVYTNQQALPKLSASWQPTCQSHWNLKSLLCCLWSCF